MGKLCLNIFIDAFGWELLKEHSFLDDILKTKSPLNTIFGYSSTCDPTIVTGKLPREHGHFSFFYHNPAQSPFKKIRLLGLLPKSIMNRGRVRHHISKTIKRFYGYTGYFQIYNMPFKYLHYFDYSEKRDLYEPNGINNGQSTIFDYLRDNNIKYYMSDWRKGENYNLKSFEEILTKGEIAFAYLYLAAMDADLHKHGTHSTVIDEKIKWYDKEVRKILTLAQEKYDEVTLFMFSDHGMTNVFDICDLIPQITALNLDFGEDYTVVYDSTMARFWFFNQRAKKQIIDTLNKEEKGHILTDEQLQEYGCDFKDNMYGDLFYLMNPGVLLCPSFMGEKPMKGMHGYAPGHKDSVAMFASNRDLDQVPNRLDNLYQLMLDELLAKN